MNPEPNQPAALQFDKAEIAGEPALICAACKTPIVGEYYQANGQTICPNCRNQVSRIGVGGSEAARFGNASVAGILAGVVGFFVYYLTQVITGWDIGLIAIAVGWAVGAAVRWGSEGRGGQTYQFLAAGITYVAACATYLPSILEHTKLSLISAFVLAMQAPWLEGARNIIGWIILGFAVYQAWIMNRKMNIEISGPFFARQATPPAAP